MSLKKLSLSKGFLEEFFHNGTNQNTWNAFVQIIDIKCVSGSSYYSVSISDEISFVQAIVDQNHLPANSWSCFAIINLKSAEWLIRSKDKQKLKICDLALVSCETKRIGFPQNLRKTLSSYTSNQHKDEDVASLKDALKKSNTRCQELEQLLTKVPAVTDCNENKAQPDRDLFPQQFIERSPSGMPAQSYTPRGDLTEYSQGWIIKARVDSLSDIREWQNENSRGRIATVHLTDEQVPAVTDCNENKAQPDRDLIPQQFIERSPSGAMPAQSYTPIGDLTEYSQGWIIKARVDSVSDIREWQNENSRGRIATVYLTDEQGDQIEGIMFNKACDRLHSAFQLGQTYTIKGGRIQARRKPYRQQTSHSFQIIFEEFSAVTICSVPIQSAPATNRFNFQFKMSQLSNAPVGCKVDVVAIAKKVGRICYYNSRKNGEKLKKRVVTLVDETDVEVQLALWNAQAENEQKWEGEPVVVIQQAAVALYNNRYELSCVYDTRLFFNLDMPESVSLQRWWEMQQNRNSWAISHSRPEDSEEELETSASSVALTDLSVEQRNVESCSKRNLEQWFCHLNIGEADATMYASILVDNSLDCKEVFSTVGLEELICLGLKKGHARVVYENADSYLLLN